ncbi:MAG: VWA domain-containing protein [Anaerolineales bacterium]|nr:VWA domain-containing protein [Anaerolineales bacterium]
MSFLFPLGFLGLLALPVITLLHLQQDRPRRFVVSSLRLWNFLEEDERGGKPRRLPLTPLLVLDLTLGLLFTLALVRPQVALPILQRPRHAIVLLDVSTSMAAEDESPSRFARASGDVQDLIAAVSGEGVVTLVAFGDGAHLVGDTRQLAVSELVSRLNDLAAIETGSNLPAALTLAESLLDANLPAEIHVFTDGTYAQPDLTEVTAPLVWHAYGRSAGNQAVLGVAVEVLSQDNVQVFARLVNFSAETVTRPLTLSVDGEQVDQIDLTLPPQATQGQVWNLSSVPEYVQVGLGGSDVLAADDRAALGVSMPAQLHVVLVAADPAPLDRALAALPGVELEVIAPETYLPGTPADLTVLRDFLPEHWPAGTVLVFDPPGGSVLLPLAGSAQVVDFPDAVSGSSLAEVDFSGVRWGTVWTLAESITVDYRPLLVAGEIPLVVRANKTGELVFVVLADLNAENLTRHPAFPTLVANLVQAAGSDALLGGILLGTALQIDEGRYVQVRWRVADRNAWQTGTDAFIPDAPDIYQLALTGRDGETETRWLGVNAGDRQESDLTAGGWLANAEAQTVTPIETFGGDHQNDDLDLTPWLLGLAALLLVLEGWLAWR